MALATNIAPTVCEFVASGTGIALVHPLMVSDFSRITSHIVLQALRHGGLFAVRRSIRANPPLIDDTTGELGTAFADRTAQLSG